MRFFKRFAEYAPFGVFLFLIVFVGYYALEINNGGNSWKTADWLINYDSGLIRRGLIGTLIIWTPTSGMSLLWTTFAIQMLLYFMMFINVVRIFRLKKRDWRWYLILFSPAFLLFPFYGFPGGFRKEIIGFVAFSYLCLKYASRKLQNSHLFAVTGMLTIAFFSHELNVLVLPFFVYLLVISYKEQLIRLKTLVLSTITWAVIGGISLILTILRPGDAQQAKVICSTITSKNLKDDLCLGAIAALGWDTSNSVNRVIQNLRYESLLTPLLLLVSLIPLFLLGWFNRRNWALTVTGFVSLIPLYIVALDWGRWIHILVTFVFCTALSVKFEERVRDFRASRLIAIPYMTLWSIPHCCVGGMEFGLLGFAIKATVRFADYI